MIQLVASHMYGTCTGPRAWQYVQWAWLAKGHSTEVVHSANITPAMVHILYARWGVACFETRVTVQKLVYIQIARIVQGLPDTRERNFQEEVL